MALGKKRFKTAYPGVYYREDEQTGKRSYYIRYRRGGRDSELHEERIQQKGATPKIAATIREQKIRGEEGTNEEKREAIVQEELTFKKLFDLYQESLPPKIESRKADNRNFKHLVKIHNRTIDSLTTREIDTIRIEKSKTLKPQTVKLILSILTRTINFSVKKGYIRQPDSQKLYIEKPKFDNTKTEYLNDEQLKAYLKALDEEKDQNAASFLRIIMHTGIRRGAMCGLRWQDIDFKTGFLTLEAEYAKNDKTQRIPVNDCVLEILTNLPRTSEFVFPGRNGKKRTDFRRIARRVRDKAGLPKDFRPLHGLRHDFATRLVSSGKFDLYTTQRMLTHKNPITTQRYAHLTDEAMRRAASMIPDLMTTEDKKNDEK